MVLFSNTFMVSLEVWTEFVLSGPWPKDPYSPACEVSVLSGCKFCQLS